MVKNQTEECMEKNEKIYLLNPMKIGRKMKLKCDLFAMDEVEHISYVVVSEKII